MKTITKEQIINDLENLYLSTFYRKYLDSPRTIGECKKWIGELLENELITIYDDMAIIK